MAKITNKKTIALTCNWGQSSKVLLDLYKTQTPNQSGIWKNIQGVESIFEADYIVAFGPIRHNGIHKAYDTRSEEEIEYIEKNADRVLQFRQEPDFIEKWNPMEGTICNYDYSTPELYHIPDSSFCGLTYDEATNLEYTKGLKTKNCSIIASSKHQHRAQYIIDLVQRYPKFFDFYGFGWEQIAEGLNTVCNFRGPLPRDSKRIGLQDYHFSVALENSAFPIFSEKITDPMMYWTIPLYWGCTQIEKYFPEHSYRKLDMEDISSLKEQVEKPIEVKEILALTEARNLIMNKYRLWPTIHNVLN